MSNKKASLRERLTNTAINSRCTICGKDISFKEWECSEKRGKYFFVHKSCLFSNRK